MVFQFEKNSKKKKLSFYSLSPKESEKSYFGIKKSYRKHGFYGNLNIIKQKIQISEFIRP